MSMNAGGKTVIILGKRALIVSLLLLLAATTISSCQLSKPKEMPRSKKPAPSNTMVFAYEHGDVYGEIRTITTDGKVSKSLHSTSYPKYLSSFPVFSPDRRTIVYGKTNIRLTHEEHIYVAVDRALWLMDANGEHHRELYAINPIPIMSWMPDGKGIIHTGEGLGLVDLKGKSTRFDTSALNSFSPEMLSFCISPSAGKVVFYQEYGEQGKDGFGVVVCDIVGYSLRNPRVVFRSEAPSLFVDWESGRGTIPRFCWLDDSKLLFVSYSSVPVEHKYSSSVVTSDVPYNSTMWLINTDSGAQEKILESDCSTSISFSPPVAPSPNVTIELT